MATAGGGTRAGVLECIRRRSEEHTSEFQSPDHLVCRLLLEKKKKGNRPVTKHRGCGFSSQRHLVRASRRSPTAYEQLVILCFFFNDTSTTEIYTLSLHDALPIYPRPRTPSRTGPRRRPWPGPGRG